MLLWFTTLSALVLLFLYLYFTRNNNYWRKKKVYFIKPVPFFGNIFDAIVSRKSIGEFFRDAYNSTDDNPFIGMFIMDKPCLLLRDSQLIKSVLISDFQHFYDRTTLANPRDDPIAADILFVMRNPEWKEIRGKVTPIFSSANMKCMVPLTEKSSQQMVDYLRNMTKQKPVVDLQKICEKFTLNVVSSAVFGIEANSFGDKHSDFEIASKKLTDWRNFWRTLQMRCYFIAPGLASFFRMKFFDPVAEDFFKNAFLQVMQERIRTNGSRNDLIDILLQMQNSDNAFIRKESLISQAFMFLVAGVETTTSAMTYVLYELAQHEEIQSKVRAELLEVAQKYGGINHEAINNLTYLEMCIKETMRKHPPLPFLDRMCIDDYKLPGTDVVIDKGIPVFISPLGIHHDPNLYPNPEIFDPERFSSSSHENNLYLAFGLGPRNCIGMRFGYLSLKVGLAYILKHFSVLVCEETEKNVEYEPKSVTLTPIGGIHLMLKPSDENTNI